jgi:Asp-tRNA(Asn)/Glu-tRNA(Gln) amidotransferase A subunit family amidase
MPIKAPPYELSITAASAAFTAGELTPKALLESCLDRISEREAAVGAFVRYDAEAAIDTARRLGESHGTGPLYGIPVGIKDIIDTADMPTECNSPIYKGHRPTQDAVCVARLRKAGAIILGKTVTTEFASTFPGPTRHPRDSTRTPGGSSSGSAAAVGDCMLPLALGTQTGGSMIRPSAFNGVVGYKPAWGLFDTTGVKPLSVGLDTIGFMVRSLDDVPVVSGVLADRTPSVPVAVETPKIAVVRSANWDSADPETQSLLDETAERLKKAGAIVRDVALPEPFDQVGPGQRIVMAYQAAEAFEHEWANHRDALSGSFRSLIERGLEVSAAERVEVMATFEQCRAQLPDLFAPGEIILTPSAVGEAPIGLHSTGDSVFNRTWTALHVPCLTVPVTDGPHGMPLGVQFVDPHGNEATLLGTARWAAQALDLPLFG